jgi:hypothetical protein
MLPVGNDLLTRGKAMDDVISQFNSRFAHWKIRLPEDAVSHGQAGQIAKEGWAIWYRCDSDEAGEFLDYYASHRMTDDAHVRLRAGREPERLSAIRGFRVVSPDPEENARLEAEYDAHNASVNELLERKGFGLTGLEPGSVAINRFLRTGRGQAQGRDEG